MKKIVAVASGGGHWGEMRRILPALDGLEVVYASVDADLDPDLAPARYYRVRNVSRHDRLGFAVALWQCARLMWRERPEVVISTGAAPGLVALAVAKLFRSRTVWIDSIANTKRLSLSGRLARPVADAWLVQWPHLARPGGPDYWGAVL